jgi:hypothetical protein
MNGAKPPLPICFYGVQRKNYTFTLRHDVLIDRFNIAEFY